MTPNLPETVAFLPNIGVPELLIVLAIVLLILGPKQIPRAARSLGSGLRNFRSSVKGEDDGESGGEVPEKTESSEGAEEEVQSVAVEEVVVTEKGEKDA